jgi:hypothetical protein
MFLYDTLNQPPSPVVRLRITDTKRQLQFDSFDALVDTGSDITCIPLRVVNSTPNITYERCTVEDPETHVKKPAKLLRVTSAFVEFLDINNTVLFSQTYRDFRLLIRTDGILGRDVLNQHNCEFQGPVSKWFIRSARRP